MLQSKESMKSNDKKLLTKGSKSAKNTKSNYENKNKYHLYI